MAAAARRALDAEARLLLPLTVLVSRVAEATGFWRAVARGCTVRLRDLR